MSKKNPATADLKAGLYLLKYDPIATIWLKRRIEITPLGECQREFIYDIEILNSQGIKQCGKKVFIRKTNEKHFVWIGSV